MTVPPASAGPVGQDESKVIVDPDVTGAVKRCTKNGVEIDVQKAWVVCPP